MIFLFLFLLTIFPLALFLGFRHHDSGIWHYVDIMYYPLAAIGVALLFVNTTEQRKLLELSQLEEVPRRAFAEILEQRPKVHVILSKELVDSSFGVVATISEFADACSNLKYIDTRCIVAERLAPSIVTFLKTDHSLPDRTLEIRLSVVCPAADKMILEMGENSQVLSFVGEDLISQYKEAMGRGVSTLSIESLNNEIDAFRKRADSKLDFLRSSLYDKSKEAKHVMDMYQHEIEFGSILLQGLSPCISSARKDVEVLGNWTKSLQTKEEQLAKFEADRKKISSEGPPFPELSRLHLNIWPYVLIFALSLKFAKGASTVKKHRSSKYPMSAGLQEGMKAESRPSGQPPPIPRSDSSNDQDT